MTTVGYEHQAAAALAAVSVRPPAAYLWFGRRWKADGGGPDALVAAIARRLGEDWFGPGAPRPARGGPVTPADDGGSFARALAQANCGRGSWQAGWRAAGVDADGVVVVRPDGLRLLAPEADCRAAGAGDGAHVRVPKDVAGPRPGVYVALGDAAGPAGDRVRLYWNLAAAGAVTFVARATFALNRAALPFALELPDNPARYGRGAAVSIAIGAADVGDAVALLAPLRRTLGPQLADGAPAFTKPLARGLALAEEPAAGPGFGAHRCRLLAEAIVGASARGQPTVERRLAAVRERFAADGVSLDAPYLRPGGSDAYDLP